ncbi:MAG: hypothetical protein PVF43_02340 [Candidatus Eiseniibacteriota bacterium]|jgi:hypothetical protein
MITSISSHRQRRVSTGELLLVIVVLTAIAYLAVPRCPDAASPAERGTSQTRHALLNPRCEDGWTGSGDDASQSVFTGDILPPGAPICLLATPDADAGGDHRVDPHAQ